MISPLPELTPLCELARKYGTDKSGCHEYTPFYYGVLKGRAVRKVLEVGIGHPGCMWATYQIGASLRMWEEFFPDAEIYAFDIEPSTLINRGRIHSFLADQTNPASLLSALEKTGREFDLIIEDGSHIPEHQIVAAQTLVSALSKEGIYVTEDVLCDPQVIISKIPEGFFCEVQSCLSPTRGLENILVIRRA